LLELQNGIEIVGEAISFGGTIRQVRDLDPQVIVIYLPLLKETKPASSEMKSLLIGPHILVISFWTDVEARAMAESFGATALLDKRNLTVNLSQP
jgi:hypothetical protein